MLGNPKQEYYRELKSYHLASSEASLLRNCEFWVWDKSVHEKLFDSTGGACCFWHIMGLPEKEHLVGKKANGNEILHIKMHGMKLYEKEWFDALQENRYLCL